MSHLDYPFIELLGLSAQGDRVASPATRVERALQEQQLRLEEAVDDLRAVADMFITLLERLPSEQYYQLVREVGGENLLATKLGKCDAWYRVISAEQRRRTSSLH